MADNPPRKKRVRFSDEVQEFPAGDRCESLDTSSTLPAASPHHAPHAERPPQQQQQEQEGGLPYKLAKYTPSADMATAYHEDMVDPEIARRK